MEVNVQHVHHGVMIVQEMFVNIIAQDMVVVVEVRVTVVVVVAQLVQVRGQRLTQTDRLRIIVTSVTKNLELYLLVELL